MKKSIFNWMMAIALVATPMVFVSCSSDDDNSSSIPTTDSEGTQAISYGMRIILTKLTQNIHKTIKKQSTITKYKVYGNDRQPS